MELSNDDVVKVLISVLCGSLLGFEREYRNKTAGFRTIILICLGSTVFTMISQRMGFGSEDRVAANILTGIGFIGAGVIFKDNYSVTGITTAAVIWIASALGMVVGIGQYHLGFFLTFVVIFILSVFHFMEGFIDMFQHREYFNITFVDNDIENLHKVEKIIAEHGLKYRRKRISKSDDRLVASIKVSGNRKRIRELNDVLVLIPQISRI